MNLAFYRDSVNKHGVKATLYHAAYRAANRVAHLAVWDALAITLERVDPSFLADPQRASGRMVDPESLRPYVARPDSMLTDAFLDEAGAKGDRCYAFFHGNVLASYGWYTSRPTRVHEISDDLVLHFDPAWVYMYAGYTHPDYRGRRLHAVGMSAALEALTREGKKGLVSYVDASNDASLRSCARMGYETFGRVMILEVAKQYVCHASAGCAAYGFSVEHAAPR